MSVQIRFVLTFNNQTLVEACTILHYSDTCQIKVGIVQINIRKCQMSDYCFALCMKEDAVYDKHTDV